MFAVKFLANPAFASNCYIVLNMLSVFTVHISRIAWGIIFWLVIVGISYQVMLCLCSKQTSQLKLFTCKN